MILLPKTVVDQVMGCLNIQGFVLIKAVSNTFDAFDEKISKNFSILAAGWRKLFFVPSWFLGYCDPLRKLK